MKKSIYYIFVFLLITSCAVNKQPVFIKVDNVKIISADAKFIKLKADAFFENLNDIGGKISTDSIKVIVNGVEVAQVSSEAFKVPAKKEFTIPLLVEIPTKKILDTSTNGILGGLLNAILNKSIKVQFKGKLKYKVLGFSKVYPIDKMEEIKIKF